MEPSSFDEANATLGPPRGMRESAGEPGGVASLRVWRGDGRVVSCWKPTRAEIDEIARTGRVWVQVLGDTMPPMSVEGVSPFTAAQGCGT